MKVWFFLGELIEALMAQLRDDDNRWGDVWLKRTRKGQEERTQERFDTYFAAWKEHRVSVPWLKVIGGAFICWIRERHPEIWPE